MGEGALSMAKKSIRLLITGVPATGKTTLAKDWANATGSAWLSLNSLVEKGKFYSEIDESDMSKVVRLSALSASANKWLGLQSGNCVIEGHLGCEFKLNVDKVAVLRLEPSELERRLKARGYVPDKIYANKMSELLDYCTIMSLKNYGAKKVYEIDMTGRLLTSQSFEDLGNIVAGTAASKKLLPRISWSEQLMADVNLVSGSPGY